MPTQRARPRPRTRPASILILAALTALGSLAVPPASAQSVPTTINYQGRLLQNTATQEATTGSVDIVFSIWSGPTSDSGAVQLWTESWTGVTLSNGIFSVLLGTNGSPLDPADFQGDASLYLELEVDGETLSPRQQLGSAPFAIVDEPENELQDLSLAGDTLELSDSAATVDLSPYLDDTDEQDLSLSINTLSLTSDPTPVDLSGYLDNTDVQTLSLSGNDLSISGSGSSVDLGSATDVSALSARVTSLEDDFVRTVFVTSQTYEGDLGGLNGADVLCQGLADAAGLEGTFMAWLSDPTNSPSTRFGRLGSFELVDGTSIANDWEDLTDGSLSTPINQTEEGTVLGTERVWSATAADGTFLVANQCREWSENGSSSGGGGAGTTGASDSTWTNDVNGLLCDRPAYLFCFEQVSFNLDSQTLQLSGDTLRISGTRSSVDLSGYRDNTDDQQLSLSGNDLQLTSDDGTDTIGLSGYLDNTDGQTLSLSGDDLSISGSGSSVDLSTATEVTTLASRLSALEDDLTRTVFVTSQTYIGGVGGLTGADALCQGLANTAGLPGTFLAWLSDSTHSPSTRFGKAGSFVLIDGTTVADSWNDLTDGILQSSINQTELGDTLGSERVWTGTGIDGQQTGSTCLSWISGGTNLGRSGFTDASDTTWTDERGYLCDTGQRLYCFEQPSFNLDSQTLALGSDTLTISNTLSSVDLSVYRDNTDAQALSLSGDTLTISGSGSSVDLSVYLDDTDAQTLSLSGNTLTISGSGSSVDLALATELAALRSKLIRTVFVTSQDYAGNFGGLSGADAVCQGHADAAGLTGTYLAWLSDSTGSPSTRFSQDFRFFELVDGTRVADDWADLTDGALQAKINMTEQGTSSMAIIWTWTNTQNDGTAQGADSCLDWTSDAIGTGHRGEPQTTGFWTEGRMSPEVCSSPAYLYCFER